LETAGVDFDNSPGGVKAGFEGTVATAGEGLDFNGVAGTVGLGGGAFSMDLPCLNIWNIPAKTSIIIPTINNE
jgi:hypothetical protein